MKTRKILLLFTSLLFSAGSFGDVIPSNAHYVDKCVKITNVEDYPEISLIGYIKSFTRENDCYLITSSACLYKGYKLNTLYVYAVSNNYIAGKDPDGIDWPNDKNAFETNVTINPYYGYIADSIPLSAIEEYYKIMGFTDTCIVLHKWKEIKRYNDGTPDSEQTFIYEGKVSSLMQHIPPCNEASGFTIFPNPTGNSLTIMIDNGYYGSVGMDMLNINGRLVSSYVIKKEYNRIHFNVPVSRLQKGAYLLKFRCGDMIETKKVMID